MKDKKKSEKDPEVNMSNEDDDIEKETSSSKMEVDEEKTSEDDVKKPDYKELEAEYEKVVTQSLEYFEGWQRERADFLNYKKRIERDRASLQQFISGEIIRKYLAVVDDMELAIKNRPSKEGVVEWMNGIDLIYQKLVSIIENEGVELIPTDGEFDPNIHEALTQIDSPDVESGKIVEVMRKGYKIGDRVIRPALVVVAR